MSKRIVKGSKIGTALFNYINNNKREYLIVIILFFIGLIIGVLFVNNLNDIKITEVNNYLNELCSNITKRENIDLFDIFKKSMKSNIFIMFLLWFGASTIVGIPIVYGINIVKGFSIGCTISCLLSSLGTGNGLLLSFSFLMLHNIIFIPVMFSACVSGVKLYKSIMKNKQRNNIKIEILRHTIFCLLMLALLIFSSLIEAYVSTNIAILLLNYIKI